VLYKGEEMSKRTKWVVGYFVAVVVLVGGFYFSERKGRNDREFKQELERANTLDKQRYEMQSQRLKDMGQ